ncbi:transcription factor bHLH68-like [Andrographis paniculata]|uniref:transcription factor bHLH68-like n=1 Tax=Andrographis paniculata TaxID=175694 RepID=UPI0021E7A986|nr:transcription factor bHLH68-like [Andrographis paniculata]
MKKGGGKAEMASAAQQQQQQQQQIISGRCWPPSSSRKRASYSSFFHNNYDYDHDRVDTHHLEEGFVDEEAASPSSSITVVTNNSTALAQEYNYDYDYDYNYNKYLSPKLLHHHHHHHHHPHQNPSSQTQTDDHTQCNSSTAKKARIEPSGQSSFKVRKEKLGDRITALHQIVSPFGKTDTASVLLEAIGYIRFLQSQIEALSRPYMGNKSSASTTQHDHPDELVEEQKKDLRSRGLCLVPISWTVDVGSHDINGADYWAPAFCANFR